MLMAKAGLWERTNASREQGVVAAPKSIHGQVLEVVKSVLGSK
jgi:hypothetical protein